MEELMKEKDASEFISELCLTPLSKVTGMMVAHERSLVQVLREKQERQS